MLEILPVIVSYLLGSLSFSYMIGKWMKGIDVRKHGSGNAGATNTLRVLGTGPGLAVLFLDIVKGVAGVWLGKVLAPDLAWIHVACAVAAVVGHNWPVFFRFQGGKGVATTIGAMASLSFFPALYAGVSALLIIALTRYVSLGSLLFTLLLPVFMLLTKSALPYMYLSLVMLLLVWYRHRSNIAKLLRGTENQIGQKKDASRKG